MARKPVLTFSRPATQKSIAAGLTKEIKRRQATLAKERDELRELKDLLEDLIDDADTAVSHLDDAIAVLSKFQ